MPNPLEAWPESWDDRSKVSYSEAGQSQAQYVEPMRVYDFDFDGISRERMNELREVYKTYGIGAIIWFDPTEANHEFITPMYAVLDSWGDNKKRGKSWVSLRLRSAVMEKESKLIIRWFDMAITKSRSNDRPRWQGLSILQAKLALPSRFTTRA